MMNKNIVMMMIVINNDSGDYSEDTWNRDPLPMQTTQKKINKTEIEYTTNTKNSHSGHKQIHILQNFTITNIAVCRLWSCTLSTV